MLHGGLGSGEMYAPILPLLSEGRRVITVDLQAHGHTADVDRLLRFETLAGELLRRDYDWSADLAKITAAVMLVFADADAVRPAHIVEFYGLLGGGLRDATWDGSARSVARLAILPGRTHYDIVASADLTAAVIPFLNAPSLEPPTPHGR